MSIAGVRETGSATKTGADLGQAWLDAQDTFRAPGGARMAFRVLGQGDRTPLLMLHGFPTWSFDYAELVGRIADRRILLPDFIGFGGSQKEGTGPFAIADQAEAVLSLLDRTGIGRVHLLAHDYGTIVAQELLRRGDHDRVASLVLTNASIFYEAYRPTRLQTILPKPVIGPLVAATISAAKLRQGLDAVRGADHPLSDRAFDALWVGISRDRGHKRFRRQLHYNAERDRHAESWERAMSDAPMPKALIWGLQDPVSGAHIAHIAQTRMPEARFYPMEAAGHFPQDEDPDLFARHLLAFLTEIETP